VKKRNWVEVHGAASDPCPILVGTWTTLQEQLPQVGDQLVLIGSSVEFFRLLLGLFASFHMSLSFDCFMSLRVDIWLF